MSVPAFECPAGVRIDPEAIVDRVVAATEVDEDALYGRSRGYREMTARGVAARLLRELTPLSLPKVAKLLRRPRHTSVIKFIARINREIEAGHWAREVYLDCGRQVGGKQKGGGSKV